MHVWILTLVCATVYGISRISEPDLQAVNFAKAIKGHKLNGSVINEIDVDSESSCQVQCVLEEKCFSYNFGPINVRNITEKNAKTGYLCQLSNFDRFSGFVNFTEDKDFIYRGLQVNKLNFSSINFIFQATDYRVNLNSSVN